MTRWLQWLLAVLAQDLLIWPLLAYAAGRTLGGGSSPGRRGPASRQPGPGPYLDSRDDAVVADVLSREWPHYQVFAALPVAI